MFFSVREKLLKARMYTTIIAQTYKREDLIFSLDLRICRIH